MNVTTPKRQYNLSISQEIESDEFTYKNLVEVALFCDEEFVPCGLQNWVSGANNDAVIRM